MKRQAKVRESFFDEIRERALKVLHGTTTDGEGSEVTKEISRAKDVESTATGGPTVRGKQTFGKRRRQPGEELAQQLVIPDFFVDVPSSLNTEWLAYQRPEGPRVLVVACSGRCYVYAKTGVFLASFPAALPRHGCTFLDAVLCLPPKSRGFPEPISQQSKNDVSGLSFSAAPCLASPLPSSDTGGSLSTPVACESQCKDQVEVPLRGLPRDSWIAVVDALSWGDCSLGGLPAECRRFILSSKFSELEQQLSQVSNTNRHIFRLVETIEATAENLENLYFSRRHILPDTISDSIIFVHKEALYLPGVSQLYLCWRDTHLSRFPVDTNDGKSVPERQVANLWLRFRDGAIQTEDYVTVARLQPDTLTERLESLKETIYIKRWRQGKLKDKMLIRAAFTGLDLKRSLATTPYASLACSDEIDAAVTCKSIARKDGEVQADLLVNFEIVGTPSPKRITAETLNRLIHQFLVRQQLEDTDLPNDGSWLTFNDILVCAATGAPNFTLMMLRGTTHLESLIEPDGHQESDEERCEDFYEEDVSTEW